MIMNINTNIEYTVANKKLLINIYENIYNNEVVNIPNNAKVARTTDSNIVDDNCYDLGSTLKENFLYFLRELKMATSNFKVDDTCYNLNKFAEFVRNYFKNGNANIVESKNTNYDFDPSLADPKACFNPNMNANSKCGKYVSSMNSVIF